VVGITSNRGPPGSQEDQYVVHHSLVPSRRLQRSLARVGLDGEVLGAARQREDLGAERQREDLGAGRQHEDLGAERQRWQVRAERRLLEAGAERRGVQGRAERQDRQARTLRGGVRTPPAIDTSWGRPRPAPLTRVNAMDLTPLRIRPVRHLIAAYGINQLGDWSGEIALAVGIYAATRSPLAVSLTFIAHRAALAPLAPLLVAQLERRFARPLLGLYLLQAAVFVAIAATIGTAPAAVAALVLLDGLLAPAARAFARAGLAALTRPLGLLRQANALANVLFTVNGVLAPALGALLVALAGPAAALLGDALTFLITAALIGALRVPATEDDRGKRRVRAALAHVRRRPILAALLVGDAAVNVFVMAINPIEVVYVIDTIHAGAGGLGIVAGAWGAGMIAGGAAAGRGAVPLPVLLGLGALGPAAACLGMGLSTSLAPVAAWSALGGVGNGLYGMAFVTAIQERTADAFQARVGALRETTSSLTDGVAFALGGFVAAAASPRAVYVLAGMGALVALAVTASRLRTADWTATPTAPQVQPAT
jgi:hypothetical protein